MTARTRAGIAIAFVLVAFAGLIGARLGQSVLARDARDGASFSIMGTVANFTFYGAPADTQRAIQAGMAEFNRVNRLCSIFDPESELSRLNDGAFAEPFACSGELWRLLKEARKAWAFSGGAFDISAKPLMDLWGFYRKRGDSLPLEEEIAEASKRVGLDKVIFDDEKRTVHFTVPGMSFDLGGIAKGYAVDQAAKAVIALGIRRGVVDLGGNLRLLPEAPPHQEYYRIGVRGPDRSIRQVLRLQGGISLSTSGDYERYVEINGIRYGHIMDPATGMPVPGGVSVTVLASNAMEADWLSTSVFIRGEEIAEKARKQLRAEVLFVKAEKGE